MSRFTFNCPSFNGFVLKQLPKHIVWKRSVFYATDVIAIQVLFRSFVVRRRLIFCGKCVPTNPIFVFAHMPDASIRINFHSKYNENVPAKDLKVGRFVDLTSRHSFLSRFLCFSSFLGFSVLLPAIFVHFSHSFFFFISFSFLLDYPIMILPCHHISLNPFCLLRLINKLYFKYAESI